MVLWSHRDLSLQVDINDRILNQTKEVLLWEARRAQAEEMIWEAKKEKDYSRGNEMKASATDSLSEANRKIVAAQSALDKDTKLVAASSWLPELSSEAISHGSSVEFENCCLCYSSLRLILPILKGTDLASLNLDGNGLGDESINLIRDWLISGDLSVDTLSLRNTSMTTDGVVALCGTMAALPVTHRLSKVDIRCNGLAHSQTVSASVSSATQFNSRISITF